MNKERMNLWVFGHGLTLILTFIGVRASMKHGFNSGSVACLFIAGFMFIITLFYLPLLGVIYKYWMKGAHFIGSIVTSLLLSAVFYLVFGTTGVILRILNKDFLDRRLVKEKKSYWQQRINDGSDKKRYIKQF